MIARALPPSDVARPGGSTTGGGLRGVALFGGGTGGHLFPGLALCEELARSEPGCRVYLFRTRRAVEARVVGERAVDTVLMDLDAPGSGFCGRWRFARQLVREVAMARRRLAELPIDVVVGLGGYPSLPGILAARLEGLPIVLLEQNVVPGKVNRLLGPLADCVACPGPEGIAGFGRLGALARLEATGNPLRLDVADARRWRECSDPETRRRGVGAGDRRVLLVMGGSQGAGSLNRFMVEALSRWPEVSREFYFIHITGDADKGMVEEAYRRHGCVARVSAFEEGLPALLATADLVLTRAGGTSVAEIAALGVPSVLVPYPGHRDRHQLENARVLAAHGAAVVLDEAELGSAGFDRVLDCLRDDAALAAMSRAALECAQPYGTQRVVSLLRRIANAEVETS